MISYLLPDCLQAYYTSYTNYLFFAYLLCVLTTFLQIRLGIFIRIYCYLLIKVFEFTTKYTDVWEEEEENKECKQKSKAEVKAKVKSRVGTSLLHRDAINALRSKIRNRSNSGTQNGGLLNKNNNSPQTPVKRTIDNEFNRLNNNDVEDKPSIIVTQSSPVALANLAQYSCLRLVTEDTFDFVAAGLESICEDEYNHAMESQELPCWNLLSRSRHMYQNFSFVVRFMWFAGFFVRYVVLLPVRLAMLCTGLGWMGISMFMVPQWPETGSFCTRKQLATYCSLIAFRLCGKSCSVLVTHHGTENMPQQAAISVANHTTPIDILVLNLEKAYALTGQKHGGMMGFIETALRSLIPHLWFERTSQKDRQHVTNTMRQHLTEPTNPPILIFPEGVCVNNTAVVLFRKGAFEVTDVVYPIAMQYDAKFCEAFWYQDSWLLHLWDMLTSWAIVCHVWHLPCMHRKQGQTSVEFADEVKAAISAQAGLRFLSWDGMLKMYTVKPEMRETEKREYSEYLLETLKNSEQSASRSGSFASNTSNELDNEATSKAAFEHIEHDIGNAKQSNGNGLPAL